MDGVRIVQVWGKKMGEVEERSTQGSPKKNKMHTENMLLKYMLIMILYVYRYRLYIHHIGIIFARNSVQTFSRRGSTGKPQWMVLCKKRKRILAKRRGIKHLKTCRYLNMCFCDVLTYWAHIGVWP